MIYLKKFCFPDEDMEYRFILGIKKQCYNTFYPFKILSKNKLTKLEFDPITILYGGNGSGKSTALNIITEKLSIQRESIYNKSSFYQDYLNMCEAEIIGRIPKCSRNITSDDVFDYMFSVRTVNDGIDDRREELFADYLETKYAHFKMRSLEDYEQLKKINTTRRYTQSKYVKKNLMGNIRELSNGESAYMYFTEKIVEDGLYLLDEPENSLSPQKQLELAHFIEESARFFGCQFIISTHSPFFLVMKDAKIYDLDEMPVQVKKWTQLESVRFYYDFFKERESEF